MSTHRKADIEDFYQRWEEPEVVKRFSNKKVEDFFDSETRFFETINGSFSSVLDIGCASGRLIELLRTYRKDFSFTGVDLSQASINSAIQSYPDATFYVGNALEIDMGANFDLINATGVFQHEPLFVQLLDKMMSWSSRYVLFDVKIGKTSKNVIDIKRSFSGSKTNRLYFNILSREWLLQYLASLSNVERAIVYGYETSNRFATYPEEIGPLISAGVLIELKRGSDDKPPQIEVDLPEA